MSRGAHSLLSQLLEATCIAFFDLQSFHCIHSQQCILSTLHCGLHILTLALLHPSYKDSWEYSGPISIRLSSLFPPQDLCFNHIYIFLCHAHYAIRSVFPVVTHIVSAVPFWHSPHHPCETWGRENYMMLMLLSVSWVVMRCLWLTCCMLPTTALEMLTGYMILEVKFQILWVFFFV